MRRTPTLQDVQRVTRAQVCAQCPYRTPGTDSHGVDFARPCESRCALFNHLPVLREAARQLDPMVGNRPRVLQRLIRRIGGKEGAVSGTTRHNGRRVVYLLERLFG